MTTPHTPVLVLAAGQRCGSTLLQRLLTSHPGVLIWGEHGGQLGRILEAADSLLSWSRELGGDARAEFSRNSHQSWMANLTPDRDVILRALRTFVDTLYVEPAVRLGRPVWGLKEVRYTLADARRLRSLYPGLAVILLIRDPHAVLRSLDEWERKTNGRWTRRLTEDAVVNWQRVAEDFLAPPEAGLPVLRLRYEDFVADPGGACEKIARHTGLDAGAFDPEVLATRVHVGEDFAHLARDIREWHALPASLRRLLDPPQMRSLIHACGYRAVA
ncbi:sulfotransferase [Microbispora sp. NPDC049125]|uniref:sulfotransferase family protein n=1 Tax=Microbispora sp. NPDC049125 TaxID=3154929 RepID=UPI003465B535